MDKWVTLSRSPQTPGDSDGFFEDLSPAGVWAHIQPLASQDTERSRAHQVRIRYHAQVTIDTRILYGTRELFVRSVEDIDEQHAELRLFCEEIYP